MKFICDGIEKIANNLCVVTRWPHLSCNNKSSLS